MGGAAKDPVWRRRPVVLVALLLVGVLTAVYAVVATRSDEPGTTAQDDTATNEVVTVVRPSGNGDGPLRLDKVLVVGRHGDPVAKPEQTAESYDDAIDAGVDYVEAEVVLSKDGQLVVRDSNELSRTTDVADHPEFADRRRTKRIGDDTPTDWFAEDFTLAELRTLRAVEPRPDQRPESASHDGDYAVLGFDDLLTQIEDRSEEVGRDIGLFVRPLRPAYFREIGRPLEPAIAKALRRAALVLDPERVTVESPDLPVLDRVERLVGDNVLSAYVVPAANADALGAGRLADLPDTIDAVAVETGAFAGRDACQLADRVHDADLALMVYPVSYENALLGPFADRSDPDPGAPGDLAGQLRGLLDIDTDVIFAESPTEVVDTLADLAEEPDDRPSQCAPTASPRASTEP